jgi:hypothetical protein
MPGTAWVFRGCYCGCCCCCYVRKRMIAVGTAEAAAAGKTAVARAPPGPAGAARLPLRASTVVHFVVVVAGHLPFPDSALPTTKTRKRIIGSSRRRKTATCWRRSVCAEEDGGSVTATTWCDCHSCDGERNLSRLLAACRERNQAARERSINRSIEADREARRSPRRRVQLSLLCYRRYGVPLPPNTSGE